MTIPTIPASVLAGGPASMIEFAVQCGVWDAAKAVAPLAASLGSSVGVTVMLFPLFTVVRSSGLLGSMLPQALFAACMLPDILGRIIARCRVPSLSTVEARPRNLPPPPCSADLRPGTQPYNYKLQSQVAPVTK